MATTICSNNATWIGIPDPKNIPQAEAQAATWMSRQNSYWVNRAESLGWEPETAADKTIYLQSVAREKARREGQK